MNEPSEKSMAPDRFRHRQFGVYNLTYEARASLPWWVRVRSLWADFKVIRERIPHVKRLLAETIMLAPVELVAFVVTTAWQATHEGIHLYWLSVHFGCLMDGFNHGGLSTEAYRSLVVARISYALIDVVAERIHKYLKEHIYAFFDTFLSARSLELLNKRLRRHFVPKLISASLKVDLLSIQDLFTIFPVEGRFGTEFPGGPFLRQSSHFVKSTLGLTCQFVVLFYIISCRPTPEREVMACFCLARGLAWWLVPRDSIGASGYVYWPINRHFKRMKALFGLAFSTHYRFDLMLDGITSSIETEYEKSAEQLGDVEIMEPMPWCTPFSRNWCWDFLMDLIWDLPLAIYSLIRHGYPSSSAVASMALLQQATKSISLNIGEYTSTTSSLLDIFSHAKRLYEAVDYQNAMRRGTESFPRLIEGYDAGMKISFRNVSLRYPNSTRDALHDVSFDILPGELVLVVGTNGSGKSTMLKLIARLFDPTAGEIWIDDVPAARYDVDKLRGEMGFQSRSPAVYPFSVRDNIAFGVNDGKVGFEDKLKVSPERETDDAIKEAAKKGGCTEWIARLKHGYDAMLEPSFDVTHGWLEGMYGYPSEALQKVLECQQGSTVSLSEGEKQRLASARTLMRIQNRQTRLLVIDEATTSLDPVGERDVLTAFLNARKRGCKTRMTTLLVTHRFDRVAHEVDRIICMKDGRVVECGTHAQLVCADGEYATLYRAQVPRTLL